MRSQVKYNEFEFIKISCTSNLQREVLSVPKIIENVEKNIIDAAFQLFSQKGYNDIEMKAIAKKAGIAVGTLYNYFPNKKELFIEILINSWKETFNQLNNVLKLKIDPIEKMKKYLFFLYDEVEEKKALGNELIKNNIITKHHKHSQILCKEDMVKGVESILKEIREKYSLKFDEQMDYRMSEILLISVFESVFHHTLEKEYNKKFIAKLVECLIEED